MVRTLVLGMMLAACSIATAQERPLTKSFTSPVKGKDWKPDSYGFGQDCSYPTEKEVVTKRWGHHLGEDLNLDPGTVIVASGDGKVMYVGTHKGESKDKRNWGGVVILAHWISNKTVVFTLYGHLEVNPKLKKGDFLKQGEELGKVAKALSPENGWWEDAHLHFQCNLDPKDVYRGGLLMGYAQRYVDGKLTDNAAPNRVLDNVAPSAIFKAKDPIAFLKEAEADPKRK